MHPAPKPARTKHRCKIKRVDPPFRSVSTPRGPKDLHVSGRVDPETAVGTAEGGDSVSEWSAENLSKRLRSELTPRAWNRLVRGAACRGTSVEQFLRSMLSEVA